MCDALLSVAPDAPTLCEGWTAHDLAAHLWTRENDPIAVPGAVFATLKGLTQSRMERAKRRWTYEGLVEVLRQGPPTFSLFALPGLDEQANTLEYFIHTEDVRRANGLGPRPTDPAFEDVAWRRVKGAAKLMLRGTADAVVLERAAAGDAPGEQVRVKPGSSIVTVVGEPSELMLFVSGRRADADVELIGEPAAVTRLLAS